MCIQRLFMEALINWVIVISTVRRDLELQSPKLF